MDSFEPAYDFASDKADVSLGAGVAEIRLDGKLLQGAGEVRLQYVPRAHICFDGKFAFTPAEEMNVRFGQSDISFVFQGHEVKGFPAVVGDGPNFQEFLTLKWRPSADSVPCAGDETTQIKRLVFHLFNFVPFIGLRRSLEANGGVQCATEYIELDSDRWGASIKSLAGTSEGFKALKAEGGYRLTHVGCIENKDDGSFPAAEAKQRLDLITYLLSFAKGGWCHPVCPVGFNAAGERVWGNWSSPSAAWRTLHSWFDPHNSEQLADLFSGFSRRYKDDDSRATLREVIYWYLNANQSSRGIDAGIVLTQAAIERLSFHYAVRERRLITAEGFKKLWASDKSRLLLSSLDIPIEIPHETEQLRKLALKLKWLDAPHALSEIRNSLVHPEHKHRDRFPDAYYDAWNLGLWQLEMAILAICGYSGTYGNRLKERWVGQVEPVPWCRSSSGDRPAQNGSRIQIS